jgi:carbon-monoxide dehydrogenase medium subunit
MNYIILNSIDELMATVDKAKKEFKKYMFIAGGTDVMVSMKSRRALFSAIDYLIDVANVKEMKGIKEMDDKVWIGAATTVEELRASPVIKRWFSAIHEASERFATWQIRNVATIGGNICTSSPASSLAPALLVYDAEVEIASPQDKKYVPLKDFFVGPKKNILQSDEVVTGVVIKKRDKIKGAYEELGKREGNIIPIVNCAVALDLYTENDKTVIKEAKIALGSVSPTPVRAPTAENFLKGKKATFEVIEEGSKKILSDINPITDFRASKEYRQNIAVVLVKRALSKLVEVE